MSSQLDRHRGAIEAHLNLNWAKTVVAWPGVDFTPPDGAWIQSTILWGAADMGTVGNNELLGTLVLNLFDRPGTGYGTLYGYAEELVDLFDRKTVDLVEFGAAAGPSKTNVQESLLKQDTRWVQLTLTIPFSVEESV